MDIQGRMKGFTLAVLVAAGGHDIARCQDSSNWRVSITCGVSQCVSLEGESPGPTFSAGLSHWFSRSTSFSLILQTDRITNMDLPRQTGALGSVGLLVGWTTDTSSLFSLYGNLGAGLASGLGYNTEVSVLSNAGLAAKLTPGIALYSEASMIVIFLGGDWIPGEAYMLVRGGVRITLYPDISIKILFP